MPDNSSISARTYTNPVYAKSFPDPYVLKFQGEYFAYSTGFAPDGNVFEILRSPDLVNWTAAGSAMQPLPDSPPFYWAPEVTYSNGKFYLYYSVGNETLMELRVAVSESPDGGFVDSGHRLTSEDFAIDAHVFIDDDGRKYMFYATDFLDHTHIGTGTVVDEMLDWFTLAGKPRPVTRARFDWQVYDPQRKEKGGVRWHTVEGPTVLKRKGVFYEMFSGGNWQNTTYGVSFAISDSLKSGDEWQQFSDGEKVLPILRTIPNLAVGPGHNSVVRGPNNRELYCVYHRWTDEGRVLSIDRMDFSGSQIFVIGSTYTPQPFPFLPFSNDRPGRQEFLGEWKPGGDWAFSENEAISGSTHNCSLTRAVPADFVLEATIALRNFLPTSHVGFRLSGDGKPVISITFNPDNRQIEIESAGSGGKLKCDLPDDFDPAAAHLWRIELEGRRLRVKVDAAAFQTTLILSGVPRSLDLFSENASAGISGIALTEGFEDLFDDARTGLESTGWKVTGDGDCSFGGKNLRFASHNEAVLYKTHRAAANLECAFNGRLVESYSESAAFGLALTDSNGKDIVQLRVIPKSGQFSIWANGRENLFDFAMQYDPSIFHQFRIVKIDQALLFYVNENLIFETVSAEGPGTASVRCKAAAIELDMARVTLLN